MFVSRVQQVARRQGVELITRPSMAAATTWLEAQRESEKSAGVELRVLIVDLKGVADPSKLSPLVRACGQEVVDNAAPVHCLAFGPHVKVDLLESARQAGFEVMTQGQFDRNLDAIFASLF